MVKERPPDFWSSEAWVKPEVLVAVFFSVIAIGVSYALFIRGRAEARIQERLDSEAGRTAIREELMTSDMVGRYRNGLASLNGIFDRWFGPDLFGYKAFDRCLLIAFFYPMGLFLLSWLLGGPGSIGAVSILPKVAEWPVRIIVLLIILAVAVIAYFATNRLFRARPFITKRLEGLLGPIDGITSRSKAMCQKVMAFTAKITAVTGALAITVALALAYAAAYAAAVAAGVAVATEAAFAVAVAFAVIGGVAVLVTTLGAVTVALAAEFKGARGAVGVAAAFAAAGVITAFISIGAGEVAIAVVMPFYLVLPLANGVVDVASWAVTRWLLRNIAGNDWTPRRRWMVGGELLADLVFAVICLLVLSTLLPTLVELLNLGLTAHGIRPVEWRSLVATAQQAPFTEGIFITGMLLTTLFPTVVHLACGFWTALLWFQGDTVETANLIPEDGTNFADPGDGHVVTDVLRKRRRWLPVAVVLSLVFIYAQYLLFFHVLLHQTVGGLLADAADCATMWSHGVCKWM